MTPIEIVAPVMVRVQRDDVWAFISDTDRLNRVSGLPPVRFIPDPDRRRKGYYRAAVRIFGMTLEYDEEPFEWIRGEWYEVTRRFSKGPIARVSGGVRLADHADGTTITVVARIIPRGALGSVLAEIFLKRKAAADVIRVLRRFEAACAGGSAGGVAPPDQANEAALVAGMNRLRSSGAPAGFCDTLERHIRMGSDIDVSRIRPFEFADRYGLDRGDALGHFLRAVSLGALDLYWSALCPNCRAPSAEDKDFARFAAEAHCDTCDISFGADLAASVEAVFRPHSSIRTPSAGRYCIGGPANAKDVVAQLRLGPGAVREARVALDAGRYHVRVYPQIATDSLRIGGGESRTVDVVVDSDAVRVGNGDAAAGPVTLRVTNGSVREALVNVERETWVESAATAARVISLQTFRDLFPTVVVPAGCELSVSRLALLFTDLEGSTALYQASGDASAFAFVQRHFQYLADCARRHGGGVVKTIGDAVMAAFAEPADAVLAAFDMQRGWAALMDKEQLPRPTALKIGVHAGRCFAVNTAGRLDYFGSMVNEAARIQGQASGGETTLLSALFDDPGVQRTISAERVKTEKRRALLKGIEAEREIVAVRLAE